MAETANREHHYPPYELLSPEIFERMALVMGEGLRKYGKDNWKKGGTNFIDDIPRHAFKHIMAYMQGDTSEDHLANAACNIMMMMWYEEQWRQGKSTNGPEV